MEKEEILSKTISYLRFPLIVGVVFIHNNMSRINIQGKVITFDQWPIVPFIFNLISSVLGAICVPLFFIISGFLLFYKIEDYNFKIYKKKCRSRCKSLLIPYLIWNFIGFLILLIELHPLLSSLFPLLKDYRIDISHFLSYFWIAKLPISMSGPANPINTPLWFIRDLIILVIMSPIIFWAIKKVRFVFIFILFIIWFFSMGEIIGFPGLCHQSLFFFPLGAYFSISKIDFVQLSQRLSWAPYIYIPFAITDTLTIYESYNYWIHNVGIIIGIIAIINIVSTQLYKNNIKTNQFLSNASFIVFALHNLILGKFTKIIMLTIQPQSPYAIIFIYFFVPLTIILLCLIIYKLLNKHLTSLAKIMTGGR